ncbi:PepSY domain-containing protein [Microbacterium sp. 77mftsu3.1]|uniref:PepSY domain-containing protein n=1 Tax=Microbacterium sp. 77mftsu3.1 TaxID=1761802 RepID=UPI0003645D1C|nr:hypothetical protein [Microbacterium sp. 77mftsu3.1]SDG61778.1 Uncharacterized membrane protein YkoI [Microbacterium sp. 77mftsu3.1]
MSENNTTPDQTTAPTEQYATVAEAPTAPKRRGRTALIAGGATLGALLLVGGGVAVGSAVADDRDEDGLDSVASSRLSDAPSSGVPAATTTDTDDDRADDDAAGAASGSIGAAGADELGAAVSAAKGVADGAPTSIDADRDGSWDVTLTAPDGAETEVRVSADGKAVVRETEAADADDRAPKNVLDAKTLATMVDAALAEQPGRVLEIDADDDNRSPFDVSILTGERQIVEVTLDASGKVIATEIDD